MQLLQQLTDDQTIWIDCVAGLLAGWVLLSVSYYRSRDNRPAGIQRQSSENRSGDNQDSRQAA